jgi:hypothetical protein
MHSSLRALLVLAVVLIAPAAAAAAPSITITTPPDGAFYPTAPPTVLANYACAPDPVTNSPITQCDGPVINGAVIDTATAGSKVFTVTTMDFAGATNSVTHNYTVDGTPPAIALTTPAQGAVFAQGEAVMAAYGCTDPGGTGPQPSCVGTVPDGQLISTTPGTHTFTVTAIDNAGNTTVVTHSYRASICSRTGATVSCELWARPGTIDLPGALNVPTKTFADHTGAPAITQVGGPTLDALAGDTVTVTLHNDLAEPLALAVPQLMAAPNTKIAAGATGTYTFVARLGTSIYEAGSASSVAALDENVAKQVAQGLYGAIVVRPAAQTRQAYGTAATAYDEEALMLLSDIDPALNANPATFDMTTFAPKYALINGRPYDGTAGGALPIVSAPGHDVLLRLVNAGVHDHPIGLLGLRESVVGESSHALLYPRSAIATSVVPGGTADALVHLPSAASASGHYALYDTGMRLYNGSQAGYGGMLTTIDATGVWSTTCAGPVTSRVHAPDTTTGAAALAFTAYVTPCAAAPASTITAAEYFIDTVGVNGAGTAIAPPTPNPVSGTVTQAQLLSLGEGRHTIYVHGQDSTGAWGEVSSDTFVIARIGPAVRAMTVNPDHTNLLPATTHLSATADATAHAGRTVAAAEYFVDPAGPQVPGSGTALALNGNSAIVALDGDVPLTGLTAGVHTIVVEAQDDLGNWGATSSVTFVIDTAPPVVTAVTASPSPNNGTVALDGHPGVLWVTATITDGGPNPSAIKAAEGFIDPVGTPALHDGWNVVAVDGQLDQPVEQVTAAIPLGEIAKLSDGSHVFAIRALDAAGNWGIFGTGTLQIDKTGPAMTAATLTPASATRNANVTLNATAADGSFVERFEYFLDQGPATVVILTGPPSSPRSITRTIHIASNTTGTTHFVFVRARDGAGNWSGWTALTLTVTNALGPLALPEDLGPVGFAPVTAPIIRTKLATRITVRVTGRARLVSIRSAASGVVRARFIFAPHGIKVRGTKTLLRGRDAAGRTVLWVLVRGNAAHGYQLRAVGSGKRSPWLSLHNRRVVLEAALRPGTRPTLTQTH